MAADGLHVPAVRRTERDHIASPHPPRGRVLEVLEHGQDPLEHLRVAWHSSHQAHPNCMTAKTSKTTSSLTQKTVKGFFWAYASFLGGKGLNFLTTIILARLLLPAEFGLIGYCLVVIQYVDILNSAGIDTALIARREKVEEAANAAVYPTQYGEFQIRVKIGLSFGEASWSILASPDESRLGYVFRGSAVDRPRDHPRSQRNVLWGRCLSHEGAAHPDRAEAGPVHLCLLGRKAVQAQKRFGPGGPEPGHSAP